MMKKLTLALLLFAGIFAKADNELLQASRKLYFEFDSRKSAAQELHDQLRQHNSTDPILKAYQGISLAATASQSMNPMTKWNRFSEGRKLIETAISEQPDNAEIRMLRFGLQTGSPSFLGYSSEIDQDALFIIEKIENKADVFRDIYFTRNVILFLQDKLDDSHPLQERINQLKF